MAACSAVATVVIPASPSVAADVTMMANITKTPDDIPATTSPRIARKCDPPSPAVPFPWPPSLSSSTSSLVCQKNKYGEIVVPNNAMSAAIVVLLNDTLGVNTPPHTLLQATSTMNKTAMYDNNDTHSQRNIFE